MSRLRRELPWLLTAVATVYVVWLAALAVNPRRYFLGDSQGAYYGWMYRYGSALRNGEWPLLEVTTASAGNHVAEGQMGLFNPVSALMALGATVAPDIVAYSTFLKFAFATVGLVGAYLLARSYAVCPPLAAAASVAVPLCGMTLGFEAPRWTSGLIAVAFLPWAWWLTRRTMAGAHPLPGIVAGCLVVTVGYVFGTLYLALLLIALLVEATLRRDRRAATRGLLVGGVCGLVAVAVHLPGLLTYPVTLRNRDVEVEGGFRLEGWDYALLGQPLGTPSITWMYVAWFLPLLVLVDARAVRRRWRSLSALLVATGLFLAWSFAPHEVGPLRWPGRTMDAFTLVLTILLVVLLQHCPAPRTRRRLALLAGLIVTTTSVSLWQRAEDRAWQVVLAVCILAALALVWRLWSHPAQVGPVLLGVSLVTGLAMVVLQPRIIAPDRHVPAELAAYRHYLPHAEGDVLIVDEVDYAEVLDSGGRELFTPDRARYLLTGSLWALTEKPVRNSYSTIGFRPYSTMFCVRLAGQTCPAALDRMLEREATSGLRRADLFSLNSIAVGLNEDTVRRRPPAGWHEAGRTPYTVTWVRDAPVLGAGDVVWTTQGVRVSEVSVDDLSTTFRVDEVPATGGSVVLSRLAWPGYRVDRGRLGDPLEEMLLRVEVPADSAGQRVSVTFRPPGWRIEVACLLAAAVVTVAWSALTAASRRGRGVTRT